MIKKVSGIIFLLLFAVLLIKVYNLFYRRGFQQSKLITEDQTFIPKYNWQSGEGYLWRSLKVDQTGRIGFREVSSQRSGIDFRNEIDSKKIQLNRNLMNGSGVALGDYDNDGLVDIYLCRLEGANKLYKNIGNWRFVDVAKSANVRLGNSLSSGAVFADLNGDMFLDLIVTSLIDENKIYINDTEGGFTDDTDKMGFGESRGSTTVSLADIDNDGDLDIYVANYKKESLKDSYKFTRLSPDDIFIRPPFRSRLTQANTNNINLKIRDEYIGELTFRVNPSGIELLELGEKDFLYINEGKRGFKKTEVGAQRFSDYSGELPETIKDWSLTVRFQDFDNDGDPDIYVCSDFWTPDRIWINNGKGYFKALKPLAVRNTSFATMSIDFSDINRDGHMDFFAADMLSMEHKRRKTQMGSMSATPISIGEINNRPQYMRNTLFLNRGDNTYAEIAQYAGLQGSEWTWSSLFMDVDLDGFEDLIITNGHMFDVQDADTQQKLATMKIRSLKEYQQQILEYPILNTSNIIFKNNGDLTFSDLSAEWGFVDKDISHGASLGDLDNDGDLDIVINRFNSPAAILENIGDLPRISVRLRGAGSNTDAIGSKIILQSRKMVQVKEVVSGGYYLSSLDPIAVFGVPDTTSELNLEILWRSGNKSIISNVKPNRMYIVDENEIEKYSNTSRIVEPKLIFQDISNSIQHSHHEDPYDDFARQPLLPFRLSQLGPGVAWGDVDSDGDDDLVLPSGRGGRLSVFINTSGTFREIRAPETEYDQTGVVVYPSSSGPEILVGHSNFESTEEEFSFVQGYRVEGNRIVETRRIPTNLSSVGALCMADVDGDGDLDLFTGGRTVPGRYPEPASSMLFINDSGTFVPDSENNRRLKEIGLITGALFSDIDSDNDPDLILAMEWGPVTILENRGGTFSDATASFGLSDYVGWWNGVTTGDFNEDGRLDIVATNWGLNTKYHASADHPLMLYYYDFDRNGTLDIVEGHWDEQMNAMVPERGLSCMSNGIDYIGTQIPTFERFGDSNLEQIVGSELNDAPRLEARSLAHMVFLSSDNGFTGVSLPPEAQFAPSFNVTVADMDGDGHEDIFLSQNFFAYQIETPRGDAGRGLWLRGDGTGTFTPVPGHESGVKVYSEQRGAAVADFDGDGRVDLVVSQNGAKTKLFKNENSNPGIRILLMGDGENPSLIGAKLRIRFKDRLGPVREIQAGSGYWSQNSWTQILSAVSDAISVVVTFPDGKIVEKKIVNGTSQISINY